jgi:hypothetical protein
MFILRKKPEPSTRFAGQNPRIPGRPEQTPGGFLFFYGFSGHNPADTVAQNGKARYNKRRTKCTYN